MNNSKNGQLHIIWFLGAGSTTYLMGMGLLTVHPPAEPRLGTVMEQEYDVSIWMPLYCDKYLLDTEAMSGTEAKAYSRILVRLWKAGGYLPNNIKYLQKLSGVSPNYFGKIWEKITHYFDNNSENIFIKPMLKELAKAKRNKESASEKGKKGSDARWNKNAPAISSGNARTGKGTGIGNLEGARLSNSEADKFLGGVEVGKEVYK